jgi:hypothetical protein
VVCGSAVFSALILRSIAKRCVSKDAAIGLAAILRDARKSALLRMRSEDVSNHEAVDHDSTEADGALE